MLDFERFYEMMLKLKAQYDDGNMDIVAYAGQIKELRHEIWDFRSQSSFESYIQVKLIYDIDTEMKYLEKIIGRF